MSNAPSSHRKTSFAEKVLWGAGGITESLVNAIYQLGFPIFSIGLGLSATLVGLAQSLPRLVDAFFDPVVGNLSDNTRTRFGRRRPYIFAGAIACGLAVPLIFCPGSGWSATALFIWLAAWMVIFFLSFAIWSIPWGALGLEMSDDYKDRTSLQVVKMVFATLALLGVSWVYKLCFFFDENEVIGVRPVSFLIGGLMALAGILSAIFIKEWRHTERQKSMRLIPAMKITLSNKPFLLLCLTVLLFAGGIIATDPLLLYVNIFYVCEGSRDAASTIMGYSGSIGVITAVVLLPFGGWFANKIGKRRAVYMALGMIMIGQGSQYFLVIPEYPYLQLACRALIQPGIMLMWALIPSMIADVCDMDALQTGARREAIFNAIFQWVWKLGATLALSLSGVVLSLLGADGVESGDLLSADVVQRMRLCMALVPMLMCMGAALCILKYPLTEKKVESIKQAMSEQEVSASS